MIKSVLEHSRRFQLDADGFYRQMEVLRGLGFNDGTLVRVLECFPRVTLMNERQVRSRIEFLMGIPIPGDRIEELIHSFPEVLRFRVEERLKPLLPEFKALGFSEDLIKNEIVREPRILGMEIRELLWRLQLLRSLKCREAIKEKISSEGEFRTGIEVKLRVDYLGSQGLIRREALEVLWKEPRPLVYHMEDIERPLVYHMEDIERQIDFLVNNMRFNIRCLLDALGYIGVHFDKQIVPRFNVIELLRSKDGLQSKVGLRSLIKPIRLKFYILYVKPYPECEKMFPRYLGDGEVKSRRPVGLWKHFKPPKIPETKEDVKNMKLFVAS